MHAPGNRLGKARTAQSYRAGTPQTRRAISRGWRRQERFSRKTRPFPRHAAFPKMPGARAVARRPVLERSRRRKDGPGARWPVFCGSDDRSTPHKRPPNNLKTAPPYTVQTLTRLSGRNFRTRKCPGWARSGVRRPDVRRKGRPESPFNCLRNAPVSGLRTPQELAE